MKFQSTVLLLVAITQTSARAEESTYTTYMQLHDVRERLPSCTLDGNRSLDCTISQPPYVICTGDDFREKVASGGTIKVIASNRSKTKQLADGAQSMRDPIVMDPITLRRAGDSRSGKPQFTHEETTTSTPKAKEPKIEIGSRVRVRGHQGIQDFAEWREGSVKQLNPLMVLTLEWNTVKLTLEWDEVELLPEPEPLVIKSLALGEGTRTIFYDEFITVKFSDGAEIWYKQPSKDFYIGRGRARGDVWVRGRSDNISGGPIGVDNMFMEKYFPTGQNYVADPTHYPEQLRIIVTDAGK